MNKSGNKLNGQMLEPLSNMEKVNEKEFNVIKLNNQWYLIDVTFGAGSIVKNVSSPVMLNSFWW